MNIPNSAINQFVLQNIEATAASPVWETNRRCGCRANVPPVPRLKVTCPDDIIAKGCENLTKFIKEKDLGVPEEPFDPFAQQTCTLDPGTRSRYKSLWAEMMRFFYLIGDFRSAMLVDRDNCPKKPLPFDPTSFAIYLDYVVARQETFLRR